MLYLTAKSGPTKGASWKIGDRPLILGRAETCDIPIADPTVSRQHCEIVLRDEQACLRDLESSNTTLVNGTPTREQVLHVGDEVAVGAAVFLVTDLSGRSKPLSDGASPSKTVSLSEGESLYLSNGVEGPSVQGRPQTIRDISALFAIGRELSRATTLSELFEILARRLRERFLPTSLWLARVQESEDEFLFYPPGHMADDPEHKAPLAAMRRTLRTQRGLLAPSTVQFEGRKVFVSTLLAPVCSAGERIGVLALATRTPQGVYEESDLEFLLALAHTAAPFIHALEYVEQLRRDNERLRVRAGDSFTLVGTSKSMARVRMLVKKIARSDLSVLILGETGTGKELVAHLVHDLSSRAHGPLVIVNCAAIPHELFESELFGHEAGAFTGAARRKVGRLEQAHGGTLFLDEVGDLSLDNQARILRAIELGSFHRVGAEQETRVDIRVVCATNRDLDAAVRKGQFRQDLYHRLNGVEVVVPPLRERPSDIPLLATHFLELFRPRAKHPITGFDPEALEYLRSRPWSGNVRELRSVVQRAIVVAPRDVIRKADLQLNDRDAIASGGERPLSLASLEREHIRSVLRACGGKVAAAARMLEISRNTLYNKIAEYGIET